MKARKVMLGVWICGSIFCACGGQKQTATKGNNQELERIENFSVDVTEDYAQIYENSSCRAVSAKIDGADCMLAYSDKLHCIDVIDLTNKRPLKQIQLVKEGPHGVVGVEGIFFYDNTFVLKSSVYLYRVNWDGHVVSKWNFNDYISGFGLRFPDQHAIFNLYTYLGFDAEEGLVALPVYKNMCGSFPHIKIRPFLCLLLYYILFSFCNAMQKNLRNISQIRILAEWII